MISDVNGYNRTLSGSDALQSVRRGETDASKGFSGRIAHLIASVRRDLAVSRAETSLLVPVMPSSEPVPLSRQALNDWICRTSRSGRGPDAQELPS